MAGFTSLGELLGHLFQQSTFEEPAITSAAAWVDPAVSAFNRPKTRGKAYSLATFSGDKALANIVHISGVVLDADALSRAQYDGLLADLLASGLAHIVLLT